MIHIKLKAVNLKLQKIIIQIIEREKKVRVLINMLRIFIFFLFVLSFLSGKTQQNYLVLGNTHSLCLDSNEFSLQSSIDSLGKYDVLFIFSGATSSLSETDLDRIESFLSEGKGVYVGCENWPLQAEAQQLTKRLFSKEFWGETNESIATTNVFSESIFNDKSTIPAGNSIVLFPLDVRLNVEAWVKDEPVILSSEFFGGRLILDGGYSRFYCSDMNSDTDEVWNILLNYLNGE